MDLVLQRDVLLYLYGDKSHVFYLLSNRLTFCVEKTQDRKINILITVPEKNRVEIKNGKLESAVLTFVVICPAKLWEGSEK